MKILKVILSKLRANKQSGYPDYKLRQVDPLHCEYKIYIERTYSRALPTADQILIVLFKHFSTGYRLDIKRL